MSETLNEIERRVLGVLLEKAMAQPDYYPMTLNAVVTACNQKNNRDPVMELDEGVVEQTLEDLRKRGLVSVVLPAPGARSNRYRHEIAGRFGWEKRVAAVMTELLLRGPQTAGELRTHCSRLAAFEDLEAVTTVLDYLQGTDPPLVRPMPRQPGQSAVRFMHLLYPEVEATAILASAPAAEPASAAPSRWSGGGGESLRADIDHLKSEVARLNDALADLQHRFEMIENELK